MRTSLTEIQKIEDHLFQRMKGEDELLFQANIILDKSLAENVRMQKKSYHLVRNYGRKQLKEEIEDVHQKLFTEPEHRSFREKILALFRA